MRTLSKLAKIGTNLRPIFHQFSDAWRPTSSCACLPIICSSRSRRRSSTARIHDIHFKLYGGCPGPVPGRDDGSGGAHPDREPADGGHTGGILRPRAPRPHPLRSPAADPRRAAPLGLGPSTSSPPRWRTMRRQWPTRPSATLPRTESWTRSEAPMQIYLDYNASTPLAPSVAAKMREVMDTAYGNPSSLHWAGRRPARTSRTRGPRSRSCSDASPARSCSRAAAASRTTSR